MAQQVDRLEKYVREDVEQKMNRRKEKQSSGTLSTAEELKKLRLAVGQLANNSTEYMAKNIFQARQFVTIEGEFSSDQKTCPVIDIISKIIRQLWALRTCGLPCSNPAQRPMSL